jgi:hypothetical protein
MTIKFVETGRAPYYVLLDERGYPLAQGTRELCECVFQALSRGDTADQYRERLKFYGVIA